MINARARTHPLSALIPLSPAPSPTPRLMSSSSFSACVLLIEGFFCLFILIVYTLHVQVYICARVLFKHECFCLLNSPV